MYYNYNGIEYLSIDVIIPDIGGALGVGKIHDDGLVSITDFALTFLPNGCIVTVVVATIWVEELVVAICKPRILIKLNK